MTNRSIKTKLHTLRVVMSFGLLGAVVAGVLFGGLDVDLRPYGAALGMATASFMKVMHVL